MRTFMFYQSLNWLILLGTLALTGCGAEVPAPQTDKSAPLFSMWRGSEMNMDLSDGREGIFEIVVYRQAGPSAYRCFVTVNFTADSAQVLHWYQDWAPYGAECRALFQNLDNGSFKKFYLEVEGESLAVKEERSGNKTLAWTFKQ